MAPGTNCGAPPASPCAGTGKGGFFPSAGSTCSPCSQNTNSDDCCDCDECAFRDGKCEDRNNVPAKALLSPDQCDVKPPVGSGGVGSGGGSGDPPLGTTTTTTTRPGSPGPDKRTDEDEIDDTKPCVKPEDMAGYRVVQTTNMYIKGFDVKLTCASGKGDAKAVACKSPGEPFTLEGCEQEKANDEKPCTPPASMTGYRIVQVVDLFQKTFHVDVKCAHGKEGGKAVVCKGPGEPYTLDGCDPDPKNDEEPCTKPASTEGYRIVETVNLFKDDFSVAVVCQSGGKGGKAVVCDAPGKPYKLEGCDKEKADDTKPCVKPEDMAGYRVVQTTNMYIKGFDVKLTCASGKGDAKAVACKSPGEPFTLEGCEQEKANDEKPCTPPASMTGYRIVQVVDLFQKTFHVDVKCAHGKEGGKAVVCKGPGEPYTLDGCDPDPKNDEEPCTKPASTEGYRIVETVNLFKDDFSVAVVCQSGGKGGKAVVCDAPGKPYKLEGCDKEKKDVEEPCTKPADTKGYRIVEVVNAYIDGFSVSVKCRYV